ncbi:MAG: hypothetical protein HQL28_06815, partial [Candidatus Omnitrophica bacterium]|nr:hypothetical protein [Candidatus Omnitrophota bacterium]
GRASGQKTTKKSGAVSRSRTIAAPEVTVPLTQAEQIEGTTVEHSSKLMKYAKPIILVCVLCALPVIIPYIMCHYLDDRSDRFLNFEKDFSLLEKIAVEGNVSSPSAIDEFINALRPSNLEIGVVHVIERAIMGSDPDAFAKMTDALIKIA